MPTVPPLRFAPTVQGQVAFQVVGEDGPCLVIVPPLAQNIEKMWEQPAFWRPIRRLAGSARFVHYDKLGTGLSDPVDEPAPIEGRVAELVAVLDAVPVESAWLVGLSEGGIIAIATAGLAAQRVAGLVLINTTSGAGARPDPSRHGAVRPAAETVAFLTAVADRWATPSSLVLDDFAPSLRGIPGIEAWSQAYERAAASPAMIHALVASGMRLDATAHLSAIDLPTLVVHHRRDRVIPAGHGRFLADAIAGARFVDIDGDDHFAWVAPDVDGLLDEILAFIGASLGARRSAGSLTPWDTLTGAERRVARLVQRGLTNAEISGVTGAAVRTVETQLTRIYAKLAVRSRTELAIRAED